jgi:hypothetical protein
MRRRRRKGRVDRLKRTTRAGTSLPLHAEAEKTGMHR